MRAPLRWRGPECRGADRLALAVTAYVNGPAFKKRLFEHHEDFAVASLSVRKRRLRPRRGRYAAKPRLKVAAREIPMRSIRAQLGRLTRKNSRPRSALLSPKPHPDRRGRWVRSELRCRAAAPRRPPPRPRPSKSLQLAFRCRHLVQPASEARSNRYNFWKAFTRRAASDRR